MTVYNYDEVKKATLDYFNEDALSADVWIKKYCLKDSEGNLYEKSPADMHRRLAKEFSRIEANYPNALTENEIFEVLDKFKYIVPQGSPMSGIGNNLQTTSISNCFVVGNTSDSYGGILQTDQEQVQLMKRRGGVGHDLGHIRPKGTPVKNSALTSTGVVPFMERYSNSTREVAQDGRRGALMLTIPVRHPDSEDFIDAKKDKAKVTGANVSVKIDDAFMAAVKNNTAYIQTYPIDINLKDYFKDDSFKKTIEKLDYDKLLQIGTKVYIKKVNAQLIWKKIVANAWENAEPGLLFWDTILKESPADSYEGFETMSVNPCGELPLSTYDSCRLLAINLFGYIVKPFENDAYFDFDLFKKHVKIAQRISDDIIDLELEKIDKILEKIDSDTEPDNIKLIEKNLWLKIKSSAIKGRRTGLGITGEGDMLAALGLTYAGDDSINFSEKVHKIKAIAAYKASVEMAKERGCFEGFSPEKDVNSLFISRLIDADANLKNEMMQHGRRNISLLTIAPTGSTSLMTQTTSGVEPVFLPYYRRRRKINPQEKGIVVDFVDGIGDSWVEYNVFHHNFLKWASVNGYDTKALMLMPDSEIQEIVEKSPYYKATSNDVDWVKKVELQGKIQKWVDHSISVTVNLPNDTDKEKVANIYEKAYDFGCKGVTIYRDGSRTGVLIKKEDTPRITDLSDRPDFLPCDIHHVQVNKVKFYVIVGLLDDEPFEIFAFAKKQISIPQLRKEGKLIKIKSGVYDLQYNGTIIEDISQHFNSPEEDAFTRTVSLLLRTGVTVAKIVDQLDKSYSNISSFYKAISRTLSKNYMTDDEIKEVNGNKCSSCGSNKLSVQEGCILCLECGHSKCG